MITWIQIVLQKHHKPVFMVLLVAIVIAFVFTIGQVPFLGDRNRSWDNAKEFYGYGLSDEGVRSNLQTLAVYDAVLGNKNLRTQRQLTQLMLRQAYLLSLARELGIIQVSETELKEYVQSAPAFRNAAGGFDAAAWKKFIAERGRMSEEALSYVIAQNALADKVEKLLGGPGYLPLSYVENQYKKYYGKWDFAVAALSFENFNPEIKVDPAELEKFFKENAEAYRIGDGAVLETVFFPSVKYAASVPAPTNAEISAFYGSNMRKYATQKDGKPYVPALSEIADKVRRTRSRTPPSAPPQKPRKTSPFPYMIPARKWAPPSSKSSSPMQGQRSKNSPSYARRTPNSPKAWKFPSPKPAWDSTKKHFSPTPFPPKTV